MIVNSQKQQKISNKSNLTRLQDVLLLIATKTISWFLNIKNFTQSIWTRSRDLFISFPIKRKLSIIIGIIVVVVIFVLSLIFQQTEKRVLTSKIEEICNLSVHYLASGIKDNLLLGEKSPHQLSEIKESVFRIKNQNINGLDYAWVINRHGDLIAHTDWKLIEGDQDFLFDENTKNFLLSLREPRIEEKETHYEYYSRG